MPAEEDGWNDPMMTIVMIRKSKEWWIDRRGDEEVVVALVVAVMVFVEVRGDYIVLLNRTAEVGGIFMSRRRPS